MSDNERSPDGWLARIERVGNRLPDPVFIFVALIALLVLCQFFPGCRLICIKST